MNFNNQLEIIQASIRKSKFDVGKEENNQINDISQMKFQIDQRINHSFSSEFNNQNQSPILENQVQRPIQFISSETLPVGILASIVKEQIKNNKNNGRPFIPYQPLDLQNISILNVNQTASNSAIQKMENFYKFYNKLKKVHN